MRLVQIFRRRANLSAPARLPASSIWDEYRWEFLDRYHEPKWIHRHEWSLLSWCKIPRGVGRSNYRLLRNQGVAAPAHRVLNGPSRPVPGPPRALPIIRFRPG